MGDNFYIPNVKDSLFVLFEQLGIEKLLKADRYSHVSKEDVEMIIKEAADFAVEHIGPTCKESDEEGCRLEEEKVYVPEVFRQPYKEFCELGWLSVTSNPELGGQGLPESVGIAVGEFFTGACQAFAMYSGLTRSNAFLIETFGTQEMIDKYCERMYKGEWGGTMCLTEAGAGSAVGDLRTVAIPEGDHYKIRGTKIFISSGDHDLNDNIIHLVLARIQGAPEGMPGVSLFVVPKFRVNDDGSLGEFNDVVCTGIEHKMGIKGSSTCTLNFGDNDDCLGWIIGEPNKGIKYMFQMMNEARLGVALQGMALSSTAYLNALQYSKERVQGVDITAMKDPNAPRVTIINHPDIRRMLLTQKALSEGMRALVFYAAYCEDMSRITEDEKQKQTYHGMLELLTPICKAYCTDWSFKVTELAIQTYGGYGYCSDYPVEQYMRDAKINSIYEGTNGIQALDLLGRKLGMKGGMVLMQFLSELQKTGKALKDDGELTAMVETFNKGVKILQDTAMFLAGLSMKKEIIYPVSVASPFLTLMGHMVIAWMLMWQVTIVKPKLEEIFKAEGATDELAKQKVIKEKVDAAYYYGKIKACDFFVANYVPEVEAISTMIKAQNKALLEIPEEAF